MNEILVELRNVNCRLGDRQVFVGLDLTVEKGEIVSVVGVSGVGKSTLLKVIGGLVPVDEGIVRVFGQDLIVLSEEEVNERVRSRMGFVFQSGALFDWMTVEQNVLFPLIYGRRWGREGIKEGVERARGLIQLMGLEGAQDLLPAQLSGGMRKRVAIARALVAQPDLVLYDEPTSGLDPVMAGIIDDLIVRLRDQLGVTGIVVTHDLSSAIRCSDRIGMLHKGKMTACVPAHEFSRLDDPVVQQFVKGESVGPLTESR